MGTGEGAELGDGDAELLGAGAAAESLLAGDARGIAGGAEFREEGGGLGCGHGGRANEASRADVGRVDGRRVEAGAGHALAGGRLFRRNLSPGA
jgi:hypothetical protein